MMIGYNLSSSEENQNLRQAVQKQKNRSNLKLLHVAGSKSFARVGHDMAQKLGYNPGRDKKIVEVHTSKKTGVPTPLAVSLIKKLQTEAVLHPELEENWRKILLKKGIFMHMFLERRNQEDVSVCWVWGQLHRVWAHLEPKLKCQQSLQCKCNFVEELNKQFQLYRRKCKQWNDASMICSTSCFHKEVTVLKCPRLRLLILSLVPW